MTSYNDTLAADLAAAEIRDLLGDHVERCVVVGDSMVLTVKGAHLATRVSAVIPLWTRHQTWHRSKRSGGAIQDRYTNALGLALCARGAARAVHWKIVERGLSHGHD